jgi:hypothetical protein
METHRRLEKARSQSFEADQMVPPRKLPSVRGCDSSKYVQRKETH